MTLIDGNVEICIADDDDDLHLQSVKVVTFALLYFACITQHVISAGCAFALAFYFHFKALAGVARLPLKCAYFRLPLTFQEMNVEHWMIVMNDEQ